MQDGQRGSDGVNDGKHFIMDGANTGLGDELVINGSFETDSSDGDSVMTTDVDNDASAGEKNSWRCVTQGNYSSDFTVDTYNSSTEMGGSRNLKIVNNNSSGNVGAVSQPISFVSGVTYKVSYKYKTNGVNAYGKIAHVNNAPTGHHLGGSGQQILNSTSVATNTYYFTSTETETNYVTFRVVDGGTIEVDDVSVKAVNTKHHATTVFYGDELLANVDMETSSGSATGGGTAIANWSDFGTPAAREQSTTQAHGGSNSCKFTVNAQYEGIESDAFTVVAGRTYYLSCEVYPDDTTTVDIRMIQGGGSTTLTQNFTGKNENAWNTITTTFVCTESGDGAHIVFSSPTGQTSGSWYIDDVTFKEVGTASGWTDADQQLDIPQTALQSFNELAWFPGTDSGTDFDINCGSGSTIDDIFNGGGTVSAWIYPVGSDTQWIVHKGHGTAPTSGWYIGIQNLSSGKYVVRLDASFDGAENGRWDSDLRVIKQGAWNHIAVNWNDDSVDNNPTIFVNGASVVLDENETPSDGSSYSPDEARDFLIGNSHDGTKPFGGAITEVSLWDTGLSKTQVRELYNDGKALDALTHSLASSNLKAYWRNNGLSPWKDLKNSNHGTVTNVSETVLIPAGIDSSRDSQGFIMNRKKDTNALNVPAEPSGVRGSSNSGPYVFIPKAPVPNASSTVTNCS